MNSDSAIHLMSIGLEYLMIAVFIVVVYNFIVLRDDYANALNDKTILQENVDTRLEFSGYDNHGQTSDRSKLITGARLMEVIRLYRDGHIRIYINKDKNNNPITFDSDVAIYDPLRYSVAYLSNQIDSTSFYTSYLVYDTHVMTAVDNVGGDEITGISFVKVP